MTAARPHVVVTGAGGGIGKAVCRMLHGAGWLVTGVDVKEPGDLPWLQVTDDIADTAAAGRIVAAARRQGPITGIVHNAAVQRLGRLHELSAQQWQESLQVNVLAGSQLLSEALDDMRAAHGAFVAVTSVHAVATTPAMTAYATTKAALEGWVRAAALDYAPHVRVNAVRPGAVNTPMLTDGFSRRPEDGTPEEALAKLARSTPLGIVSEPEDIAAAVHFLLDGTRSRFLTGAVLTADGGALMKLATE